MKKPSFKIEKAFNDLSLELKLFTIWDMMDSSEIKPKYSKKYFVRYYGVDLETFNKWIEIFCPNIWKDNYSKKKKFLPEEAVVIYNRLGKFVSNAEVPRNHLEISQFIFENENWKKSKMYNEKKCDIDELLEGNRLNILPPKIVNALIEEEVEEMKGSFKEDKYTDRFNRLNHIIESYKVFSDYDIEVRMRWIRIYFNSSIDAE